MKKILLVFSLALGGCLFSNSSNAVDIQNFRSGLVCAYQPDSSSKKPPSNWICFETESIQITGQGSCVYGGEEKRCTWYGFEFDYTNAKADDEISCISSSDTPADMGNPQRIEEEQTTAFEYSIDLVPGDGHYYNPQYSIFTYSSGGEFTVEDKTVCSIDGRELFRFRFKMIYPKLDRSPSAD